MTRSEQLLARRYATAFLNLFQNEISFDQFMALKQAVAFLAERKKVLFFLSLPSLAADKKMNIMKQAFKMLELPDVCNKLMALLLHDKRASLLYDVLQFVVMLYEQRNTIMDVALSTSHEVDQQALAIVQRFLAQLTGNDVIYTHRVDKNLIAGIRAQSDTILWEQSVEKQLRTISVSLIP